MKIIVFGATGGVGKSLVSQGLEAGLQITAFVRTPEKLNISHEKLTVIKGDAFNPDEVSEVIASHDAVISCLGSSKGLKKSTELQEMIKNIVAGMEKHQVNRIIYTASAGVHKELSGLSGKLVMALLKNPLIDHRAAVDYIQAHGLNYTIVRPMGLTNQPPSGKYRESSTSVPAKATSISCADVAHFILKALKDPKYHFASIGIGN